MQFTSWQFLVFFLVVFALYWGLPFARLRVALLLAASFYFYACFNQWLAILIFATTAVDYFIALKLDRFPQDARRTGAGAAATDREESVLSYWNPNAANTGHGRAVPVTPASRGQRAVLLGSIVMNLGLLFYFKYMNFFLGSVTQAAHALGHEAAFRPWKVILPVGISFYTFEAINYTVDVYKGRMRAERSLPHFLLFVTFFPHLVAGPIVRAREFLPQTHRAKHFDWGRMELGVQYFIMGYFKKAVIADRMAAFVDPVYVDPKYYNSSAAWLAVLAYAIQIYCDFSGYTDMALGAAHMLGYKLARNFDLPYLAVNVSDFWRRWHISLSTWLRDYLFIPLGGSRTTPLKTDRNLMTTMMLGGFWHGANWHFFWWGASQGGMLVLHRHFRNFSKKRPVLERVLTSRGGTALRGSFTFLCVILSWVLFRAEDFRIVRHMFNTLFIPTKGVPLPVGTQSLWVLLAIVAASHVAAATRAWEWFRRRAPAPVVGAAYALAVAVALLLTPDAGRTFIYFQF